MSRMDDVKNVRNRIVEECRKDLSRFQDMSCNEIYYCICNERQNLDRNRTEDDMAMRMASFMIYDLSHNPASLL